MSSNSVSHRLRALTKESAIYGLAHVLTRSITFLLLPYYSHRMSAADYGELSLYYLFLAVMYTFYAYGMDIAYLRFYNLSDHGRSKPVVTGTTIVLALGTSLGLSAVLALVSAPIGDLLITTPQDPATVAPNVLICIGVLFFDTIGAYPFLRLRSENRPLVFAGQKLINVAVTLGLNIYFIEVMGLGLQGVLIANLIASILTALLLIPGIWRDIEWKVDGPLLREMLRFGLPNIPTYLFVMIVELAGRKAIEVYRGSEEAGLYSAGYKLGMFMGVINAAFRFAWQPFSLKHASDEQAPVLFSKVLTYYVLASMCFTVWLSLLAQPLLTADLPIVGQIIAPAFWAGFAVFPLILFAHIFDGIYANLMVGIFLKKATRRLPMVTGAAAAVTIVGNLLLVPRYGMLASAWVTLAAFIVQAMLIFNVANRLYPIPYEWPRILLLFGVGSLFILTASYIDLSVPARLGLAVAFPLVLVALRFFTPQELRTVRRMFGA
ncbi:MAG: polysaccharide biosynthesis protein [bacterium]|nr:polysaccharide biosynthesis protein [bacterium]